MFKGYKCLERKHEGPSVLGNGEVAPDYPFGLSLTLQNDELEKLGLDCNDADCKVGNYIHLHILAEVMGIHKVGENITLNLQSTHAKIEDEDAEDDEEDGAE